MGYKCAKNSTAREVLAGLDAGALRQHLALGLETNSLARTPRSPPEPSPSLGDLLFRARPGRRGRRWTAGN